MCYYDSWFEENWCEEPRKELIDILQDESNPNVLDYIDDAVTAINDLLACAESEEARAEKAERKRDEYKVALQNWHEED